MKTATLVVIPIRRRHLARKPPQEIAVALIDAKSEFYVWLPTICMN